MITFVKRSTYVFPVTRSKRDQRNPSIVECFRNLATSVSPNFSLYRQHSCKNIYRCIFDRWNALTSFTEITVIEVGERSGRARCRKKECESKQERSDVFYVTNIASIFFHDHFNHSFPNTSELLTLFEWNGSFISVVIEKEKHGKLSSARKRGELAVKCGSSQAERKLHRVARSFLIPRLWNTDALHVFLNYLQKTRPIKI